VADFYNGNELYSLWKEYKKGEDGLKYNPVDSTFYMGYIAGTVDEMDHLLSLPPNVTLGQLCRIVGKYLDDNPNFHQLSASILIWTPIYIAFNKK